VVLATPEVRRAEATERLVEDERKLHAVFQARSGARP
jgi:hypothetical protein